MSRHESAHLRQISAHRAMQLSPEPIDSQSWAHASHTCAQTPHTAACRAEFRNMKPADVWPKLREPRGAPKEITWARACQRDEPVFTPPQASIPIEIRSDAWPCPSICGI